MLRQWRPPSMGKNRTKANYRRAVLRLTDLDHSKAAVLTSLTSPGSRRVYQHAIEQFIAWYCSEPGLAFNRIVVVRYRIFLEGRGLAANTINQQLAAVRRLAYEAADAGLLSPELAAGISRVKGVKQLGHRSGNWLSLDQSSQVLNHACGDSLRAKRDYAMLAMLLGCGLRRSELASLETDEVQTRQSPLGDRGSNRQRAGTFAPCRFRSGPNKRSICGPRQRRSRTRGYFVPSAREARCGARVSPKTWCGTW